MASVKLVLNNTLCFWVNRYDKLSVSQLRNTTVDFYSIQELIDAKSQLLSDISKVKLQVNIPHIPDSRESSLLQKL